MAIWLTFPNIPLLTVPVECRRVSVSAPQHPQGCITRWRALVSRPRPSWLNTQNPARAAHVWSSSRADRSLISQHADLNQYPFRAILAAGAGQLFPASCQYAQVRERVPPNPINQVSTHGGSCYQRDANDPIQTFNMYMCVAFNILTLLW